MGNDYTFLNAYPCVMHNQHVRFKKFCAPLVNEALFARSMQAKSKLHTKTVSIRNYLQGCDLTKVKILKNG